MRGVQEVTDTLAWMVQDGGPVLCRTLLGSGVKERSYVSGQHTARRAVVWCHILRNPTPQLKVPMLPYM